MAEQPQAADPSAEEQGLLERRHGLESAVLQWENDLIAEGRSSNPGENERNIHALKARRMVLYENARTVDRAIKEIRRAHPWTSSGVPTRLRRWIGVGDS